jgi:hypothetical protein
MGSEKAFEELKKLIDEIMTLGDARSYRTRRLLLKMRNANKSSISGVTRDYEQAVTAWNDKLNSFTVRLTVYAKYSFAEELETDIQERFMRISARIDSLPHSIPRDRVFAVSPSLQRELDQLNYRLFQFSRDALNVLQEKQREAYGGNKLYFEEQTLELFPTWYLFKALFKTSQPPQTVIRSPANFEPPDIFWV